jgi:hypothetical protein
LLAIVGYYTITLGYGNYDPQNDPKPCFLATLIQDRNGWYIRATWGAIVAVGASMGLFTMGFLSFYKFLLFLCGNIVVNYSVSRLRWSVYPADILVSMAFSSLIFLV